MKIIALMPVKNEDWILRTSLSSLVGFVDEIVVLNDGSADNTTDIVKHYGGIVLETKWGEEKHINMSRRRQFLLDEGRKRGGSHFVWLDADETFSTNFLSNAKRVISLLKPGMKLSLRWVALWKSFDKYRTNGIYGNLYKDFIVCDSPEMSFGNKFLSEDRTPGPSNNIIKISENEGVVLHFQFAAWNRNQMKQVWYRCSELIEGSRSAKRINNAYSLTLDDPRAKLSFVPKSWVDGITMPVEFESFGWHYKAIINYFDKYGIEFFEPLQIQL